MSTSTFIQKVNVVTGSTEWCEESEDYDYHQEVARSAYADMLHDDDRNIKYYYGLKLAIQELRRKQQPVIVLDIGTGTGLLSMMAAKLGADTIYACEAFAPMAKCAARVIAHNGYSNKIKLIPKRSTELQVGLGLDMETRANVLVTEVFDTELIGEGAIGTYNHAHQFLLEEGSLCIPASATYYAQVVDCPLVPTWNKLNPIRIPNRPEIQFSPDVNTCPGLPSVHDVQLSEIKPHEFTPLSKPLPVFKFNWSGTLGLVPVDDASTTTFLGQATGTTTAIFTWWDLHMSSVVADDIPENIITMVPSWTQCHPWRDHWMQSIYHIPSPVEILPKTNYFLKSFHNEYAFWFEVVNINESDSTNPDPPVCHCGIHLAMSRSHVGMFNDIGRHVKYVDLFSEVVTSTTACLVLSDSSPIPFILAGLGARHVYVIESNGFSQRAMAKLVESSQLSTQITILTSLDDQALAKTQIDLVAGEPYFHAAVLPWHNLYYWYCLDKMKPKLSPTVKLFPSRAILKGVLVQYRDLWKIRSSVGKVCHDYFDIVDFDKMIHNSTQISDSTVDAQPLWEYPSVNCSEVETLLSFDFQQAIDAQSSNVTMTTRHGTPNGLALWIDWHHSDANRRPVVVSTGPTPNSVMSPGGTITWDRNSQQGVYFFQNENNINSVLAKVSFDPRNGHVEFNFQPSFDL